MKVAIIGSRGCSYIDIGAYLPNTTTEIISGGAKGIDTLAKIYAQEHGVPYVEFLPDYKRYARGAPLKRNDEIIHYSDMVVAFWDGYSKGTAYTIRQCEKRNIPIKIIMVAPPSVS